MKIMINKCYDVDALLKSINNVLHRMCGVAFDLVQFSSLNISNLEVFYVYFMGLKNQAR